MRMYQDERRLDFHGLGLALKQAREARAAAICLRLQRIVQTGKSGEVSSSEMRRDFLLVSVYQERIAPCTPMST